MSPFSSLISLIIQEIGSLATGCNDLENFYALKRGICGT